MNDKQKKNLEQLAEDYISVVFGDEYIPSDEEVKNLKSESLEYSDHPPKSIKYKIEMERLKAQNRFTYTSDLGLSIVKKGEATNENVSEDDHE